jgi:hypothetical protein
MTDSIFANRWRALLLVALSVAGIVLTARAERSSESRANRLHRDDRLELAASIYGDRVLDDSAVERLHYNLGTTLLRLGSPEAAAELSTAATSPDDRIRVSAQYNFGLWSLIQALVSQNTDSIVFHATNAVEANKKALRLNPDHPDAPWNLALARRVIVAAAPETNEANMDSPNGAPDLGEVLIVEGPSPFGTDEGYGDTPSEGEDESVAGDDLEPLSLEEAEGILGVGHLHPETMTGKLLRRESRSRRGRAGLVGGPPW